MVFLDKPKELSHGRLAFISEIFKIKGTIVLKVVPQIILAAFVGLFANLVKVLYCGEGVASNDECDVTFNMDGHLGVSVVLSFLLVFRADLAYERYYQGKSALGAIHTGIRNLNVATATFLRAHPPLSRDKGGKKSVINRRKWAAKNATRATALARDRMELFRLTNLLYAFVRQAVRAQRHGYSDVGPVTDDELMTRDRGGKPRVPDIVKDKIELDEFRTLEPWNRPNVCVSKITAIIEHHRRVGNLGERAALDVFRDCQLVLDALKSAERIVTTPIPYQYLHMLNILLFFFVYSVPFVFTANFKWITPFPSCVVALAFYGVNEIGRCMEDPYSWEDPCHDLSGVGWRIYTETLQMHQKADEAHREAEEVHEETNASESRVTDSSELEARARLSTSEQIQRALAAAPVADAALHANALEEACALEDENVAAGEMPTPSTPASPVPERKRLSSAASITGPFTSIAAAARTAIKQNVGGNIDEEDDEDDALTADPSIVPKELSTHWSGFLTEIFVFKNTVMPSLLPQIALAFFLGIFAQMFKRVMCGADVVAAAECQTTFDITGHQVVSVSLGFLLVFRTDWAYDRYYEGKQSLGQLYNGLRNLNVCFVNYLRENKPGERAAFEASGSSNLEGWGDAGPHLTDSPSRTPRKSFQSTTAKITEDRAELLRLTNVLYATMRHILRDIRVGAPDGGEVTDEDCVKVDATGKPPLPDLLREGESERLLALMPSNRCNWIAMRIQIITETHRRLGNISERAAFEIYQQLEICLSAYKAMERIVSTPIPFTYLHMLQFILFFFVFSAPFVFTTTFHWIGYVPSVIVAIGFYGINEMGKLIQDPFNWQQPCHDLSGLGLRIYRENLKIHEHAEQFDPKAEKEMSKRRASYQTLMDALQRHDSETGEGMKRNSSIASIGSTGSNSVATSGEVDGKQRKTGTPSVSKTKGASEKYGEELSIGPFTFITILFRYRGTVLPKIMPQTLLAAAVSIFAQIIKIYWCGANITSHSECPLAFSETAHSVAGGIIGFMLVFRTSISYYRFYEGKKYLGHLYDCIRNANIAFNSFLRVGNDEQGHDAKINADKVELRRLSNVLYAFIRQAVREHRHGYPEGCPAPSDDAGLVRDDVFGRPGLGVLLTDEEKEEFLAIDPNNRANMVVWRMQSIVEHHRRLGHVCERGAFDIYHDLEGCLEAFKHMERIVSTKMPFQYLHMVNFLLFIFVFSAPFVFTTGFKWLSPIPSCIVAISFYGVAEVARSIEDPYSWTKPCHDLTGTGWRLYSESLQLHEASVASVDATLAKDRSKTRDNEVSLDDVRLEGGESVVRVSMEPRSSVRASVAHGAADIALLSSKRPDETTRIEDAVKRGVADGGPNDASSVSTRLREANPSQPELSDAWHGFITDIFRFKKTVYGEIIPQVLLAFVIGWVAQLVKLWRCGGQVQEAFECPVTFAPYAHSVIGSVLAFMIVYRFKFAYDRYYEAKSAIGELHCGLRNFNIGVCAFMRDAREGEPGYNRKDVKGARERCALFMNERTELLRLSGLLFGFIRHVLREQRLGYLDDPNPGDKQLLLQDKCGMPCVGSLMRDAQEVAEFSSIPFQNRANTVVTRIQSIVEHHRRLGHVCERAAFDLYRECELVLASLKSCERVVTTPIPFQYLQMSNFVTFFFTYSAPFIFTVSYQYISFFPACLLAMAFYGINSIGEVIERPFNWREPNHDLTGVGLRVWRECVQIHRRCASRDAETLSAHGITDVADGEAFVSLEDLARRAAERPNVENVLAASKDLRRNFRSRRASAVVMANELASREYPRHTFSFLTGLFDGSNETLWRVVPQVLMAAAIGAVANLLKVRLCGADVKLSSECSVTFHTEAHAICGAIIGFLLVFCANIAYLRYYEARSAVGDIYHGLRNMNIEFASFLRAPTAGEPGHQPGNPADAAATIKDDQLELRRLSNVLFAFIRQALREHRHGYRFDSRSRRGRGEDGADEGKPGFLRRIFKPSKAASFGGGTGPVSEESLLEEDLCGEPSLATLLTPEERRRYADVPVGNRFNVCVAEIQRIVARNQREGDLYEKAAYDVYKECDRVLAAFKTCERIVTTPIPYQYVHMVNLVLFFFVFSAPLVFTVTFKRLTPLPSGILALGFYGIWEVGRSMMDPFDWMEPCINLTAIGRRISTEAQRITDAGRRRHSVISGNGERVGSAAGMIARRKPTGYFGTR